MIMLAVAAQRATVSAINLRCATPIPAIATDRSASPSLRPLPIEVVNAPQQHTASDEIPIASDAPPRPTSRSFLVWALSRRGVSTGDRSTHLFPSSVSLFDLRARFFVPTRTSLALARAEAVKVGRRTNLTTGSAVARPHLDSFEHDGTLGAIGMTIGGEPACGRDQSRHNLVSGGSKDPNHDAVMRIGSEAPKRRTHSFPRHNSHGTNRDPPPRTVIGDPSQADGLGRNCWVLSATSVYCAGRRTTPSGTTPSRTSRHKAIKSLR